MFLHNNVYTYSNMASDAATIKVHAKQAVYTCMLRYTFFPFIQFCSIVLMNSSIVQTASEVMSAAYFYGRHNECSCLCFLTWPRSFTQQTPCHPVQKALSIIPFWPPHEVFHSPKHHPVTGKKPHRREWSIRNIRPFNAFTFHTATYRDST